MVIMEKIRFDEDDANDFFREVTLSKLYNSFYYHIHGICSPASEDDAQGVVASMGKSFEGDSSLFDLISVLKNKLRGDFIRSTHTDHTSDGSHIDEALSAVDSGTYNEARDVITRQLGELAAPYISELELLERYRRSIDVLLMTLSGRLFLDFSDKIPDGVKNALHQDDRSITANEFLEYMNILENNIELNMVEVDREDITREDITRIIQRVMDIRQFYTEGKNPNRFHEYRNKFIANLNSLFHHKRKNLRSLRKFIANLNSLLHHKA